MPSLGIALGLTVGRRGAAAFTPDLVSGYLGGVYAGPARSAGLLWQDSGETVAATADTDPVYVAGDPYSATEMSTNSDANRVILTAESGGKWSFKGNGTSSYLATGFGTFAGEWCAYFGVIAGGGANTNFIALGADSNASTYVGWYENGNFLALSSGGTVEVANAIATGVVRVRRSAGNTVYVRFGNAAETTLGTLATTYRFECVLANNANFFSNVGNHLSGLALYSGTPSAGDDADLMTYFNGLLP